jgi:hypothetical protein
MKAGDVEVGGQPGERPPWTEAARREAARFAKEAGAQARLSDSTAARRS